MWNELEKSGDIYLSKYSGWYSVSDEAFYADDEIEEIDGKNCQFLLNLLLNGLMKSLIFKLSKGNPLLDFYNKNPKFISPESRKNEVINFVSQV